MIIDFLNYNNVKNTHLLNFIESIWFEMLFVHQKTKFENNV